MKNIFSYSVLAMAALSLAACSDNDDAGSQYLKQSNIEVVSSNLIFEGNGSTGNAVVKAPGAIEAHINSTWAKAVVKGDSVLVTVNDNPKVEGRSTQLTIKSGNDSTNLTVQQQGMTFKYGGNAYYIYNDEARTLKLPVTSKGAELSIEGLDWAKASIDNNGITIDMTANTTNHVRSGFVYYQYGPYKDSILVEQGELKDIVDKDYIFDYIDASTGEEATTDATILNDEGTNYIYLTQLNMAIPFIFDEDYLAALVPGGSYVGKYASRYYLYTAIIDVDVLNSLYSQQMQSYSSLMASPYMAIDGFFESYKGRNLAQFSGDDSNYKWMANFFENMTSYSGDILGIEAFKSPLEDWVVDGEVNYENNVKNWVGNVYYFAKPLLLEKASDNSAKRNVISVTGNRVAPRKSLKRLAPAASMKIGNNVQPAFKLK